MAKQEKTTPQEEETKVTPEKEQTKEAAPKGKKTKASTADTEAKLAATEQQLSDSEEKMSELQQTLMRTAAEYDNFRKRSQREQKSSFNNGVSYAVTELLPLLDTLDAAAQAESTDEEYKKGVLLTLTKCEEIFNKLGIHEIEALDCPFDPELHNAVMQEEAEGAEPGTITRVMQKGYQLGDKVIRHSMVAVAP